MESFQESMDHVGEDIAPRYHPLEYGHSSESVDPEMSAS